MDQLKTRVLLLIPLVGALCFSLSSFQPIDGLIGHDFKHQLPRLLIGTFHYWQNQFAVPHFTPSLCGGIPFFADPQSMYYSLPQFLTFVMDPLHATYLATMVFYILGFWGMVKLLGLFGVGRRIAHFGALVFIVNGFTFAHLFVGHLTHQGFFLLPFILCFLFKRHEKSAAAFLRDICIFSLLNSYLIYSGAAHMGVILLLLLFVLFPVILEQQKRELPRFCIFLLLSGLCISTVCSGKLVASFLYSEQFYDRPVVRLSDNPMTIVMRYFWFVPSWTPLRKYSGWLVVGPWEYVGFVSKLTLFVLPVFLLKLVGLNGRRRVLGAIATGLAVSIVILLGVGGELCETLPFFQKYHNPIKVLSVFIVPIVIITALSIEGMVKKAKLDSCAESKKTLFFLLASLLLILEFGCYTRYFVQNRIGISYRYDPQYYRQARKLRSLIPVKRIVNSQDQDLEGLFRGSSSTQCYEPLFGYRREGFKSEVRVGDVSTISDGRYNINHPGCLVYYRDLGCEPWDRIRIEEKEQFEKFTRGATSDWIPGWQKSLLWSNGLFCWLLVIGGLLGWVSRAVAVRKTLWCKRDQ